MWIILNLALYYFQLVVTFVGYLSIKPTNSISFHRLNIFVFLLTVVIAISGACLFWGQEQQPVWIFPPEKRPIVLHKQFKLMFWLRFIPLLIVAFAIFVLIICLSGFRGRENSSPHLNRLPGVLSFLQKNAKEYHQKDGQSEQCAICLDDFKEGDGKQIAELKCSHIFHLKCLSEWVVKNDVCPMCRT